jgi:MoxR-like ATPase
MQYRHTAGYDTPQVLIERMTANVEKVIAGKRESIELIFVGLLAGGHLLLEDVPGTGKTMLVRAAARTIGAEMKRIQMTPDLMPADITGVSVWNPRTREFEFRPGPLLAHIVVADELNRASPKTQSALLEAMEERCVTVDGTTHRLPEPFVLMATQNPLDTEGTFPLPEAQLDRFLLRVTLGYPGQGDELQMLDRQLNGTRRHPVEELRPIVMLEEWSRMQSEAANVHVDESIREFIVRLTAATRRHPDVALGASPRASLALVRAAQARAWMNGRVYVIPDDVKRIVLAVLEHRIVLKLEARMAGLNSVNVLHRILEDTPIPSLHYADKRAALS